MEFPKNVWISVVIKPDQMRVILAPKKPLKNKDHLQKMIIKGLLKQTVGKCMEDIGYIKDISEIITVEDKPISHKTGSGNFDVYCTAIVIQPTEGQIVQAKKVNIIHDRGIFAEIGPLQIFSKWSPKMQTIYEHHMCNFKILSWRHKEDQILCIGEMV